MVRHRLLAIYQLLTSRSFYLFTQVGDGRVRVDAAGKGDLGDMVLVAVALKEQYDSFVNVITEAATEGGELHLLEEIKAALEVLEKK